MSASDPFFSVSNNKNNSRKDAKAQRNDYHVSVFLRAFASLREKFIFICWALMAEISQSDRLVMLQGMSVSCRPIRDGQLPL